MTVPSDLSNATLDELKELQVAVKGEVQRRTYEEAVLDGLWSTLLEAKNKGLPRGHVMQTVVKVVNEVYGETPIKNNVDESSEVTPTHVK